MGFSGQENAAGLSLELVTLLPPLQEREPASSRGRFGGGGGGGRFGGNRFSGGGGGRGGGRGRGRGRNNRW